MWIILAATVGLAALVSHHKQSLLVVSLGATKTFGEVTVQLPKGWEISDPASEQPPVVVSAAEPQVDEEQRPRAVQIVYEPLAQPISSLEYARGRVGPGGLTVRVLLEKGGITINGTPAEIVYQTRDLIPHSIREQLSQGGEIKIGTICAAAIDSQGRAIAVELQAQGEVTGEDIELVKKIAASIRVRGEEI